MDLRQYQALSPDLKRQVWVQLKEQAGWKLLKEEIINSLSTTPIPNSQDGKEAFYAKSIHDRAKMEVFNEPEKRIGLLERLAKS